MTTSYFEHASPDLLAEQEDAVRRARVAAWLRSVEIMFLELRALFVSCPEIVTVSYDQDGDVDNVPIFSCFDRYGNDVADDLEEVTALAESWNARTGQSVSTFLSYHESRTFSRDQLEADVAGGCLAMIDDVPLDRDTALAWAASFASHLRSCSLERALADPKHMAPPRPRM